MAEYIDVELFDETLSIREDNGWSGMLNNVKIEIGRASCRERV